MIDERISPAERHDDDEAMPLDECPQVLPIHPRRARRLREVAAMGLQQLRQICALERVDRVRLPTGVRVEYAGQFEREEAAGSRLMVLGLIAILVVMPLRNYHRAVERGGTTPLATMFLQIWLFGIYLASVMWGGLLLRDRAGGRWRGR